MEGDSMAPDRETAHASAPSPQRTQSSSAPNIPYKGRVRTGCLVCRARKVKCDEQRPTCQKCARLKKTCVYRIPSRWGPPVDSNLDIQDCRPNLPLKEALPDNVSPLTEPEHYGTHAQPPLTVSDSGAQGITRIPNNFSLPDLHLTASVESDESSPGPSASTLSQQPSLGIPEVPSDRFHQTSQFIYLSTVMDWMAASEAPNGASFSYFLDVVDCPLISPFDHLNWTRIKHHIAGLGFQEPSVAEALLAVQALYRAQVDRLPMTHAMSVYQAAITKFESISGDDAMDFGVVLVTAFLICLCAITLPNEDVSPLAIFDGAFVARLEAWSSSNPQDPVVLRLCAWLQLLNTTSKRPGSAGLLSASVLNPLYSYVKEVPSLSALDRDAHPERCLYDAVATPIFTFYLKLQAISNRIVDVTHYRRSRTKPEDQVEVSDLMATVKTDLACLWENRPAPLQLQPEKVREHFSVQIYDPLIAVSGICMAAFHAEIIVIGRILGDPPFPAPEAKHALDQIRAIVDGDWNVSDEGGLNPGYVRPLFVYALESFTKDDSQWAADRLRQIEHPSSRSNFLASFVESHGEAQRSQSRTVTMKFFCYQTFGVPLPFM